VTLVGRAWRWTVAALVAAAAFAVGTWVSGAFLFTRLLPSPDTRWPVAFGIGAAVAAFAGLWGQSWATESGSADTTASLLAGITGLLAQRGGTGAEATASVAWAELPPIAAGFTGRDGHLATLRDVLDPDGGAVAVAVVTGQPGIGKTALAVKAGHAAQHDQGWFNGATLFIDLHGYDQLKVKPEQALDALLRALRVPVEDIPPDLGARQARYKTEVTKLTEASKSVLVIADDASAESQVQPLLLSIARHKVVVTSRRPMERLDARLVELKALDKTDGIKVLDAVLKAARPDDDRIASDQPAAERVAEACAGLPLALQIVAGRLKAHRELKVARLADELSNEKERLGVLQGDDGLPSVTVVFQLSYRQLSAITKRVFRMLSVNPGPDLSTEAVEVLMTELPERKVMDALMELEWENLIERSPGAEDRWRMHDLLRLYARLLSERKADTDAPKRARERLFQYYLAEARAADKRLQGPVGAVPGKFKSREDALDWFHAERPNLVATAKMAADKGLNQVAWALPLALTHYFYRRRRFDDWLATLAISSRAADQSPEDRNKKGYSLTQLGWALAEQRQFEDAIEACQGAVEIFEVTMDQRGKAGALTVLGHALRGLNRFEEAIKAYRAAQDIYRTGDQRGLGIVLTNLGLAQARTGQLREAKGSHEDAVNIFRQIGDKLEEGAALTNLGHTLQDLNEPGQAIPVCRQAVEAYQEANDPHGAGYALDQLGMAQQGTGKFKDAITEHEKALVIFREPRTKDRYGEGIVLSNVGLAYRKEQRFEEAIGACQAAVAIFRDLVDPYSEGIALGRLGLALQEVGRFEEAADAHRQNLDVCIGIDDWRGQAEVLDNLGRALQGLGRFEDAIAHQHAAAIFLKSDNRPGLAASYRQFGRSAQDRGRPGEAAEWYARSRVIQDKLGDRPGWS
jgi:tetratricopeptide (TPR) repeat protein